MLIENVAYHKLVEVHWAGKDRVWHKLRADYHSFTGTNREIWRAQATFHASNDASLPGDVEFALRYCVLGEEYWDNNESHNYFSNCNSGVLLEQSVRLLNVDFNPILQDGQRHYPVTIAVRHPCNPKTSTFTARRTTGAARRLRPASFTGRTGINGTGAAHETPIAMIQASGSARSGSTMHSGFSTQSAAIRRAERYGTTISATITWPAAAGSKSSR